MFERQRQRVIGQANNIARLSARQSQREYDDMMNVNDVLDEMTLNPLHRLVPAGGDPDLTTVRRNSPIRIGCATRLDRQVSSAAGRPEDEGWKPEPLPQPNPFGQNIRPVPSQHPLPRYDSFGKLSTNNSFTDEELDMIIEFHQRERGNPQERFERGNPNRTYTPQFGVRLGREINERAADPERDFVSYEDITNNVLSIGGGANIHEERKNPENDFVFWEV